MTLRAALASTVQLVGALLVHFFAHLPLGFSLLIFFVGWPLVGTLITLDDDLPGGWSNPDGTVRPPWLQSPFWGQVVSGIGVSAAGFAIDAGWHSRGAIPYWVAAFATGVASTALLTRRM